jgi:hypothetical protein
MDKERSHLETDARPDEIGAWRWALAFPLACGVLAAVVDAVVVWPTAGRNWPADELIVLGPAVLYLATLVLLFGRRPRRRAWILVLVLAIVASAYELHYLIWIVGLPHRYLRVFVFGQIFSEFLPFYVVLLAVLHMVRLRPAGAVEAQ